MMVRVQSIESVISSHHLNNYQIPQHILNRVQNEMQNVIESWNGINITKRKSTRPFSTFSAYFQNSKNWWDQTKASILGSMLWHPLLCDIKRVKLKYCVYCISYIIETICCDSLYSMF